MYMYTKPKAIKMCLTDEVLATLIRKNNGYLILYGFILFNIGYRHILIERNFFSFVYNLTRIIQSLYYAPAGRYIR